MKLPELVVVMPVYNEAAAIGNVLRKWTKELVRLDIDFQLHVYNDGSKDNTKSVIEELSNNLPHVVAHHKDNSGHGPTILQAYCKHIDVPWLFQVDSDDEMGPEGFAELWNCRESYSFLLGSRSDRGGPRSRQLISLISRWVVRFFYGVGVFDVNSPYRLMRSSSFRPTFERLPAETFAPNVIISGVACRKKMRIKEIDVPYRFRQTGEVSIKKWKLFKVACRSFWQTVVFSFKESQ